MAPGETDMGDEAVTIGDRVALTLEARSRFPDIGTRAGTVEQVSHMIAVSFDGIPARNWVPETDLEEVS